MTKLSSPEPDTNPTYGQRLQSGLQVFLRGLQRLVIIILVGTLIGLGIYAAVRWFYPRYLIPIQTNTQELNLLKQQFTDQDQQWKDRMGQLQESVAALESQHSADRETISGLQARLNEVDQFQKNSQSRLDQLDQIQADLAALKSSVAQNQFDAQAINQRLSASDGPLAGLEREVLVLKGMELLQRSRLSLAQNNAGLARQDLLTLHDLLTSLEELATPEQKTAVEKFQARLDLALGNLPAFPVLAAQDLEILWSMVGLGLPGDPASLITPSALPAADLGGLTPTLTGTPTPIPTPTIGSTTGTPTPLPTYTPFTPVRSTTATATPQFTRTSTPTP
ncbi:MAG TPA: hypothetical protein VMT46_06650 [Anaerolineaceae bacterium]|nr:hypothetical protein [Anaerolineaceae bacterium]